MESRSDQICLPRSALETELLLASQMRTASLVLRAYAHDARTPLNAMHLSMELLAGILADAEASGLPARAAQWQRHVGVLREECGKLSRILQTLVEEQQPLRSSSQSFDLRDVVDEVAGVLRGQAARQRVQLAVLTPDRPVMLDACRDRIRQALLNVAVHALDRSPESARLRLDLMAGDGDCSAGVQHSGPPTPAPALARMAELAGDGESAAGLWAASLAAESHGGSLAIEQAQDGGERIALKLRCANGLDRSPGPNAR